ncbi:MAG: hypothetical protein GEU88_03095 [Solirubrobacterales bacterium]|nr:hypothetical protein [Solirubrobacterales bacterium]
MTEDRSEDSPEQPSVFANLPGSRPGTRSPRRKSAVSETTAAPGRDAERDALPAARRTTAPPARPGPGGDRGAEPGGDQRTAPDDGRRAEPPGQDARAPDESDADPGAGLEDLAWAGVAAAAEAATIGVRLASRAMEALRGSDRR